ncbi:MAG: tRNA 2-thiocytidine biosynthesis TtcA family protein [Clostridia bacterium]|nr:tRNA 2-thiocytidine biosynthesis TtcA family protein [Clostridia bacterium]
MSSVVHGQIINFIKDYKAIEDGDVIAIGVSGGKDSMVLMHALAGIRDYGDISFKLKAFTVSLGFDGFDLAPVAKVCEEINVPYEIIDTNIGAVVFEARKESNPCSLCANMRRGALNNAAKAAGCNKVALGHNKDDVIETFLMSQFFEGRLNTFSPTTYLSRKDLTVIRPLSYSYDKDVRYYRNIHSLPTVDNPCPASGKTGREEIREYIKSMSRKNNHFRPNLFGVIKRNHISGW